MDFTNKVALITGASRGIGASIAYELAHHNCNVCINYNNSYQEALKLKENIEKDFEVKVLLIKADITKEDEIINMINTVIKEFNKIDILVNNAGIAIDSIVEEKNIRDFHQIIDTNLIGPFLISREVSKYMLKEQLMQDLKDAMKEKDTIKKDTVQMVRAAILQIEKDKAIEVISK